MALKKAYNYVIIIRLDMRWSERLLSGWRPIGNFRRVCPIKRANADALSSVLRRFAWNDFPEKFSRGALAETSDF